MFAQSNWRESLEKLIEGNMRFRMGLRSVETFTSALRLKELAEKGQSPSAIILTCSDSRVPTEILFDKGVGDLFVIRVAGNVISETTIASIEYAAMVLNTPLCVVMGHTQCGAIQAALNVMRTPNTTATKSIDNLLKKIVPGLKQIVDSASTTDDQTLLHHCVIRNVKAQVDSILEVSAMLRERAEQERFHIVGAIYDLHDGAVSFDIQDIHNFNIQKPMKMPMIKEFK